MITIGVIVRQLSFGTYGAELKISDDHGQTISLPCCTKGSATALATYMAGDIERSGHPVRKMWQS
jgi:hypothetical protein